MAPMATVSTPALTQRHQSRTVNGLTMKLDNRETRVAPSTPISASDDFLDFVRRLFWLVLTPITLPLRLIHTALTSPLTLSLVLRLILLGFLFLSSAVFSVLAVGAFFWSWSTGSAIEVEGWLYYGSKNHRAPHVTVSLPVERFYEDLRYDVQLELELVRPARGAPEELGNFMLSLDLKAARDSSQIIFTAAQPSLPPPPLQSSLLSLPLSTLPTHLFPPCIIPWPFRSLCPSRVLGYGGRPNSKIRERRIKGGFSSPAKGKDVVLLKKELMEGVLLKPSRTPELSVGSAFVSIGREDAFDEKVSGSDGKSHSREVKTTGWVVVRFVPRPTGVRWLLSSHPLPPLLLLPPVSLSLSLSSSIFACGLITCLRRPRRRTRSRSRSRSREQSREPPTQPKPQTQTPVQLQLEKMVREEDERLAELEAKANAEHDLKENESVRQGNSTVGGSETTFTAQSNGTSRALPPGIESDSDTSSSTTTSNETIHAS